VDKSYRAIRHDIVRAKQKYNNPDVHHPEQKIRQVTKILGDGGYHILELFAGHGNLTKIYCKYGIVESYDKIIGTGDSYILFHQLIGEKRKYDVIDLDPYGYPNRFFPDIFLLIDNGYMFITMPKPHINILNGITQRHLISYYGEYNPSINRVKERIYNYGLCHWREIKYLDILDMGRLYRLALRIDKVKATEFCNVRNR
jgi:hypothetical protein